MYPLLRWLLFHLDPEQAHQVTLVLMRLVGKLPPLRALLQAYFSLPQKPVQAFGLSFTNPVGLAAGYDKDGLAWRGLACLGFGHIEIGTVTPLPQQGNPKPRLFRIPEKQAVINRMGFPGRGADFVAGQLTGVRPKNFILGVNLGKNKDTPLERATSDYLALIETFAPLADYLAINVSSPNTLGLRQLQAKQALTDLLREVNKKRKGIAAAPNIPILVKLAPDLNDHELDDALEAILMNDMAGVIATNTTIDRKGLHGLPTHRAHVANEAGGLSGAPLREMSTQIVRKIYQRTGDKLPIIAAGGVMDGVSAQEKLDAGACLVQVYTGLIYRGPNLVREIVRSVPKSL